MGAIYPKKTCTRNVAQNRPRFSSPGLEYLRYNLPTTVSERITRGRHLASGETNLRTAASIVETSKTDTPLPKVLSVARTTGLDTFT